MKPRIIFEETAFPSEHDRLVTHHVRVVASRINRYSDTTLTVERSLGSDAMGAGSWSSADTALWHRVIAKALAKYVDKETALLEPGTPKLDLSIP